MTTPYFTHHVFCCQNRREPGDARGCCAGKGAEDLRDYMKERCKALGLPKTRINAAGCLDRCELGPTLVVYPEGVWYHAETRADIDAIIAEHLQGGVPVARLMLGPKQKRL